MDGLTEALLLSALPGLAIPLGAVIARAESIRPHWLENEFRHSVIAFGGGVLLGAVALVLVPEGIQRLSWPIALAAFATGGILFLLLDRALARKGGAAGQLMAMLLDFVPESMALGAILATGGSAGLLLAVLMAAQNLPEAFNAYRELRGGDGVSPARIIVIFAAIALVGPFAAAIGVLFLASSPGVLGAILLVASGGILYLTFQDIAPEAHLARRWAPAIGAVGGFMVAIFGEALVG